MSTIRTYSQDERIHIYNLLLQIAETADSNISDRSVYSGYTRHIRAQLIDLHNIRLGQFRDVDSDGYITELPHDQQILFVLFCAQMVLIDDIPE